MKRSADEVAPNTCALAGCGRARYRDANGRVHDYCGRSHANEAMQKAVQMSLEWHCKTCTLFNDKYLLHCAACGSARSSPSPPQPILPAPGDTELLVAQQVRLQSFGGMRPSMRRPFTEEEARRLGFAVRYELEVLFCAGVIAEDAPCAQLLDRLASTDADVARRALRMMAIGSRACSDPLGTYERYVSAAASVTARLAQQSTVRARDGTSSLEVHRVALTPAGVIALPISLESSNRTLRDVHGLFGATDRMIRAIFVSDDAARTSVAARKLSGECSHSIATTLRNGFRLCGRDYAFLGFSTSQLKQGACWFFAANTSPEASPEGRSDTDGTPRIDANDIRALMGDFSSIHHSPAKVAARMGQCLSTTVPHLYLEEKGTRPADSAAWPRGICLWAELPDVERNGYTFSDGIGTGSPTLFCQVAKRFELTRVPSALQIRLGGVKGMISIDTRLAVTVGADVAILNTRPSMNKFASQDRRVEVCEVSGWRPGRLNRQLIIVLLTRGVPACTFLEMFEEETRRLLTAPNDSAYDRSEVGEGSSTEAVAIMREVLAAGLYGHWRAEPWCMALVRAMQRQRLAELRAKCSLNVELSALLFGVMDERGVLPYGQVFVRRSDTGAVLEGEVFIVKMPACHPGDVLRLTAVDHPELRAAELFDVVVFPQVGPRPHPDETSGGDLDGDKFLICWDPQLLPPSSAPPADYRAAAPPAVVAGQQDGLEWMWGEAAGRGIPLVDCDALGRWFVAYLANQNLGQLSNAHMAWADQSSLGAQDPKCLHLAQLCSHAVDFQKSGKPAAFPIELKPRMRPDYMEGNPNRSYASSSPIGQIYRQAGELLTGEFMRDGDDDVQHVQHQRCDPRFLREGYEAYLPTAVRLREAYCVRLSSLLEGYGVESEAELLAGRPRCCRALIASQYRSQFDVSQVGASVALLISDTRQAFHEEVEAALACATATAGATAAEGNGSSSANGVAAHSLEAEVTMRLASACYYACYQGADDHPLRHMSFPWVAAHRWLLPTSKAGAGTNMIPGVVAPTQDATREAPARLEDDLAEAPARLEDDLALARRLQDEEDRTHADFLLASALQAGHGNAAGGSPVKPPPGAPPNGPRLTHPTVQHRAVGPHPVAIDGMNIGMNMNFRDPACPRDAAGRAARSVSSLAILKAIEHYETLGHPVMTFLPEWCVDGGRDGTRHAQQHELLWPLMNRGILVLTPARMDDDNWLLDHAKRTADCKILTNDHLESHITRGKVTAMWRDQHVIKFCFVHNELRPIEYESK